MTEEYIISITLCYCLLFVLRYVFFNYSVKTFVLGLSTFDAAIALTKTLLNLD